MLSVFPTAQGEGWQCHGGSAMPSLQQVEMQQLTKMHGFHQEMVYLSGGQELHLFQSRA